MPEARNITMEKRQISFSPPDITEAEVSAVADVLRSDWITTGPRTKEFEKRIAKLCGTNKAVALGSATACLESILRFLGIGAGDEVITSAYTYTASASPAVHVGATLKFIDVASDSFEMDYEALEAAITEKTKVIVPVDIAGVPCDYDRILDIVERKKALFHPSNDVQRAIGRVIVAADSAHAFGASYMRDGERIMCGNVADFTSFSFHAVKNLTTAEGGALTWRPIEGFDDEYIYKQFMLLSLHGQTKDAFHKNGQGNWEYDIVAPSYKCNMTDIQAAIGLVQLDRYDGLLKRRRDIIERYDTAFKPLGLLTVPHFTDRHTSSGHLYLLRIPGIGVDRRNALIVQMAERGIATNVHFKPLPMMTAYKNMGFDIADFPNAYHQYENEITLPLNTKLSDEDVEYIINNLLEILHE